MTIALCKYRSHVAVMLSFSRVMQRLNWLLMKSSTQPLSQVLHIVGVHFTV